MREGWFLLRLHSSLRSVPLLLGHFRADANKAVEEEGMARETRALLGRWQQFGRDGPAFAEILRKEEELSRCARGVGLLRLHSSLRSVPRPLGAVSATFRTQQRNLVGLESMVLPGGRSLLG